MLIARYVTVLITIDSYRLPQRTKRFITHRNCHTADWTHKRFVLKMEVFLLFTVSRLSAQSLIFQAQNVIDTHRIIIYTEYDFPTSLSK
jgi:hypothetical protein